MSDIVDAASQQEEVYLSAFLDNAKRSKEGHLVRNGLCHNCLSLVRPDQVFCDEDCSYDYHYRVAKRSR